MQRSDGFMDWVDRMREQATVMAEKAQDAQKVGQAKWSDLQEKRRFDSLLRDLGELIYEQEINGSTSSRTSAIDATLASLKAMQKDMELIDLRESAQEGAASAAD